MVSYMFGHIEPNIHDDYYHFVHDMTNKLCY